MDLVTSNARQTNSPGASEKVRAVMIAIQQQWPHAQIDMRDPAGVWSNPIDSLSNEEVKHGIKQLRTITEKFPINAAQFRAHAKSYRPPPQKSKPQIAYSERDAARKACHGAYGNRLMRHLGLVLPIPKPDYCGVFDYNSVASAAPLPNPENHKHEWHWSELRRIFDEEWKKVS